MEKKTNYLLAVFTVLMVGLVLPPQASAEDPHPQETDVAIITETYYHVEGGQSSEPVPSVVQAPTYHDLIVTPDDTTVTFHNYVSIYDYRIQSIEYHVNFYIAVEENLDGEWLTIKQEFTHSVEYCPPFMDTGVQSISFDVDYQGEETHEYRVLSIYEWFRIKSDGTLEKLYSEDSGYWETAYVHETGDLPDQSQSNSGQ